jgi:hypothetical protein
MFRRILVDAPLSSLRAMQGLRPKHDFRDMAAQCAFFKGDLAAAFTTACGGTFKENSQIGRSIWPADPAM